MQRETVWVCLKPCFTESQNSWGWRDLWVQPFMLKQGHPEQVAHNHHIQVAFEVLQGGRIHNLSVSLCWWSIICAIKKCWCSEGTSSVPVCVCLAVSDTQYYLLVTDIMVMFAYLSLGPQSFLNCWKLNQMFTFSGWVQSLTTTQPKGIPPCQHIHKITSGKEQYFIDCLEQIMH